MCQDGKDFQDRQTKRREEMEKEKYGMKMEVYMLEDTRKTE
jgi:hypothetical protein